MSLRDDLTVPHHSHPAEPQRQTPHPFGRLGLHHLRPAAVELVLLGISPAGTRRAVTAGSAPPAAPWPCEGTAREQLSTGTGSLQRSPATSLWPEALSMS